MKVLITGAGGQLGTDLATHCEDLGDEVHALDRSSLDITNSPQVTQVISAVTPDVVFNCAAWTAVDSCEADPALAHRINADSVGHIANVTRNLGGHLVQVSTDYVFSGEKPGPYLESDVPDPKSVYGATKLGGEKAAGRDATVVRTSWVCSAHGSNMVATILRLAESHRTLRFVSDQRGRPTFTTDLARAMRALAGERAQGVFHVANHGPVSWFEFAQQVLRSAGLGAERVEPILTAELDPPRPAPRPANSVLSTEKYEALGIGELRHFVPALEEVLPAYLA